MTRQEAIQVLNMVEAYGLAKELCEIKESADRPTDIILCKDCKHINESMICSVHCQPRLESDFCNYGERGRK